MNFARAADDALGVTSKLGSGINLLTKGTDWATTSMFGLTLAMTDQTRVANELTRQWVYAQAELNKYGSALNRIGAFSPIVPGGPKMPQAPLGQWRTETTVNPDGYPTTGKTKKGRRTDAEKEADWWKQQAEQYETYIAKQEKSNRKIQEEISLLGQTQFQRDRQLTFFELKEEAERRGVEVTGKELERIAQISEARARLNEQLRQEKQIRTDIADLQRAFGNEAIGAIEGLADGSKKLNDVLADTLKMLARMVLQSALLGEGPLAGFMGTRSNIAGAVGGLFGGFFANGGATPGNRAIMTGERGPELFVPGRAGSIIKNTDLARTGPGVGAPPVVMNNDFRDSSAPAIAAINQRIDRLERNLPSIIERTQSQGRALNPYYGSN